VKQWRGGAARSKTRCGDAPDAPGEDNNRRNNRRGDNTALVTECGGHVTGSQFAAEMERKDTRGSYNYCLLEAAGLVRWRGEIYLQRKADGISAGERRTLIDNNNRQRAGRDTTL